MSFKNAALEAGPLAARGPAYGIAERSLSVTLTARVNDAFVDAASGQGAAIADALSTLDVALAGMDRMRPRVRSAVIEPYGD